MERRKKFGITLMSVSAAILLYNYYLTNFGVTIDYENSTLNTIFNSVENAILFLSITNVLFGNILISFILKIAVRLGSGKIKYSDMFMIYSIMSLIKILCYLVFSFIGIGRFLLLFTNLIPIAVGYFTIPNFLVEVQNKSKLKTVVLVSMTIFVFLFNI